jgi:hypothetical protein
LLRFPKRIIFFLEIVNNYMCFRENVSLSNRFESELPNNVERLHEALHMNMAISITGPAKLALISDVHHLIAHVNGPPGKSMGHDDPAPSRVGMEVVIYDARTDLCEPGTSHIWPWHPLAY